MLHRIQVGASRFRNKVYRSGASLWVPAFDALVPINRNVLAVLRQGDDPRPLLIPGSNIVTDAGDIYYAQQGAGETPTNAFGIHELASAGTPGKTANRSAFTTIGSTQKAHTATYPKTGDTDPDNSGTTGADVVTYLATYAKADFNAASITHGMITNSTPGASEPLLTGYGFASGFAKTADDTLKVFVNHEMTGV